MKLRIVLKSQTKLNVCLFFNLTRTRKAELKGICYKSKRKGNATDLCTRIREKVLLDGGEGTNTSFKPLALTSCFYLKDNHVPVFLGNEAFSIHSLCSIQIFYLAHSAYTGDGTRVPNHPQRLDRSLSR